MSIQVSRRNFDPYHLVCSYQTDKFDDGTGLLHLSSEKSLDTTFPTLESSTTAKRRHGTLSPPTATASTFNVPTQKTFARGRTMIKTASLVPSLLGNPVSQ